MSDIQYDPFVRGLEIAMQLKGWKAAPLSRAAGMGETAIRDLFRKNSSPKVSTAKALATAMDMTVDEIIELGEGSAAVAADGTLKTDKQRIMAFWESLSPERRRLLEGYVEFLVSQQEAPTAKPGN